MREIKFRAWSNGNYHFDGFVVYPDGKTEWPESGWDLHGVDDKILIEQYTGLRDANGVEIYEGDILLYAPYENMGHERLGSRNAVEWGRTRDSDGYAHCKHYEWTVGRDSLADVADSDFPNEAYCEVIGNIHENPELLK